MERNAVIELAVASEATKGLPGLVNDDQDGIRQPGLAQD